MSDELEAARTYLHELGIPDDLADLEAAFVRVLDHALWGGPPTMTAIDIAADLGLDAADIRREWRLFGFPDPDDRVVFHPHDVDLFRIAAEGAEFFGAPAIEHMTRAVGTGTRVIVEAAFGLMPESQVGCPDAPLVEQLRGGAFASGLLRQFIEAMPGLLLHQARAASTFSPVGAYTDTGRRLLAVGFCDLVSSTEMTNEHPDVMASAITEFERHASDVVVARGGRVVKFVGDEVMFVTAEVDDAVRIGLDVLGWVGGHEHLGAARAGIAQGFVLPRDGDIYGSTVNLAARLASTAPPGSIVVADEAGPESVDIRGFDEPITVRTVHLPT